MKKSRAPIEVFSLSFLDIISCAFGAVVMLILLAKNGEEGDFNDLSALSDAILRVNQIQAQLETLGGQTQVRESEQQVLSRSKESIQQQVERLEAEIARAERNLAQLQDQSSGLEQSLRQRQRAALNASQTPQRVDEVGGIPVDSDYVIFIVDTSGSMKSMWQKVMNTLQETLNNHPQIKGFQILSDNGVVLPGSRIGSWRKDTPRQRSLALTAMLSWGGNSNSSPVEGIEAALRAYGRSNSLALYVFGDDYNGDSYDQTLESINALNTNKQGDKIARIHAIGFKPDGIQWGGEPLKFSTVMREVTRQNNGTFISL